VKRAKNRVKWNLVHCKAGGGGGCVGGYRALMLIFRPHRRSLNTKKRNDSHRPIQGRRFHGAGVNAKLCRNRTRAAQRKSGRIMPAPRPPSVSLSIFLVSRSMCDPSTAARTKVVVDVTLSVCAGGGVQFTLF